MRRRIKVIDWLFFLSLLFLFLLPPFDPDLGWQLKCGKLLWQKGEICKENHFTVFLENYSWTNHHWLYQPVLFLIFKFFGLWGLTLFNTLLLSLTFFFFYLAIKNYILEKILAAAVIIFLSWGVFSFGVRSQLLGIFFFSLLLWLFSKIKKNPKVAIFFPLVILFWANTHGSFPLGLILLILWWLKEAVVVFYLKKERKRQFFFYTAILFLSSAATLFNPFTFKIYQEAWRHFAGVNLSRLIAEWVPPQPVIFWLILLTTIAAFFLFTS